MYKYIFFLDPLVYILLNVEQIIFNWNYISALPPQVNIFMRKHWQKLSNIFLGRLKIKT